MGTATGMGRYSYRDDFAATWHMQVQGWLAQLRNGESMFGGHGGCGEELEGGTW